MKMSEAFPIEQLVTSAGSGLQIAFARKAIGLLPESTETRFEISNKGLLMLGQTENDLEVPRQFLREVFGGQVRFATPRVRLVYADGWQQPIMGFRVEASPSHLKKVESSLEKRAAEIADVEIMPRAGVIRGRAPLVDLISYPRTLQRLSAGTAHATLWLSHYEPLWSYSTETMACYAE